MKPNVHVKIEYLKVPLKTMKLKVPVETMPIKNHRSSISLVIKPPPESPREPDFVDVVFL